MQLWWPGAFLLPFSRHHHTLQRAIAMLRAQLKQSMVCTFGAVHKRQLVQLLAIACTWLFNLSYPFGYTGCAGRSAQAACIATACRHVCQHLTSGCSDQICGVDRPQPHAYQVLHQHRWYTKCILAAVETFNGSCGYKCCRVWLAIRHICCGMHSARCMLPLRYVQKEPHLAIAGHRYKCLHDLDILKVVCDLVLVEICNTFSKVCEISNLLPYQAINQRKVRCPPVSGTFTATDGDRVNSAHL